MCHSAALFDDIANLDWLEAHGRGWAPALSSDADVGTDDAQSRLFDDIHGLDAIAQGHRATGPDDAVGAIRDADDPNDVPGAPDITVPETGITTSRASGSRVQGGWMPAAATSRAAPYPRPVRLRLPLSARPRAPPWCRCAPVAWLDSLIGPPTALARMGEGMTLCA